MPKPKRSPELRKHIVELAAAFNIEIRWVPRSLAAYDADTGTFEGFIAGVYLSGARTDESAIQITNVDDEPTYCVALHELGHKLHPLGSLAPELNAILKALDPDGAGRHLFMDEGLALMNRFYSLMHLAEDSAWEWAQAHALRWTPIMEATKQFSEQDYQHKYDELCARYPHFKWHKKGV